MVVEMVSVAVVSWFNVVSSITAVSALTIEAVVVQKTRPKAIASDGRIAPLEYWSSFFIALINVKSFRTEILLYPYWLTTSIIFSGFFDCFNPAGNGNRTRMASLEGWNFTIKLCPRKQV